MSGFQTPIKIKEAIDAIVARQYLLPAIQRKFVWSASKVEALFDSIMQGYPINSFMFWKITSPDVKNRLKQIAVPAVDKFLNSNKEYQLYLVSDGLTHDRLYEEYAKCFNMHTPHILKYDNPWMLTRQIQRADLILTTKLHVGIVGTVFGCSVVSFPWHQKTVRYYKQIGETERCVVLPDADENVVLTQLEKFKGKQITIPEELIKKAMMNIEMLPNLTV